MLNQLTELRIEKLMEGEITPSVNDLEVVTYLLSLIDVEVSVSYLTKTVAKYGTEIFSVGLLSSNLKNALWAHKINSLMCV